MSKSGKIFWLAFAAVIVLGAVVVATSESSTGASASSSDAAEATAAAQAKNEARFQLAFGGALTLRRVMRDPRSFEVSSALVTMHDQSVCYKFRARNGFGGMDASDAVLSPAGLVLSGQPGFYDAFVKNCLGESGQQLADDVMAGMRLYDARRGY